jgi:predicted nucleotidyltransferase
MNAEDGEALGWMGEPADPGPSPPPSQPAAAPRRGEYWRWRIKAAESIAARVDTRRFGVKAMYIFGSTKNGTAGPASDIDLIVHVDAAEEQKKELLLWLEGWSLSLAEANFMRTGLRTDGLLDVHLVTDEDIAKGTSYAVKIGAVTDPAESLPLGGPPRRGPSPGSEGAAVGA